jgi:hypothetical protein
MNADTEPDLVDDDRAISVLDQAPDAVRKYGQPVEDLAQAEWAEKKEGPFSTELRVRCPMHSFAPLPSVVCVNCSWFGGLRNRIIHPGADGIDVNNPLHAAKAFMVVCGHPTTRALTYVPNVDV